MRTDTTVRDVMHREFLGVSESDRLADAASLLVKEGTGSLVVPGVANQSGDFTVGTRSTRSSNRMAGRPGKTGRRSGR
jgi:predicted transcriptional regulator